MAWRTVSVRPGVPSQRQRVQLEGVEYTLDLRWNQREERWYLDLFAASGAPIATGLALSLFEPVFANLHLVAGVPPGELVVLDHRPQRAEPTLATFGDVVTLVYVDAQHVGSTGVEPRLVWGAAA